MSAIHKANDRNVTQILTGTISLERENDIRCERGNKMPLEGRELQVSRKSLGF